MKTILFFILFFAQTVFANKNRSEISLNLSNPLDTQDLQKDNKDFDISFHLESSLALIKNNLINSWSAEIPYTEMEFYYPFSKSNFIKMEIEFSYQKGDWAYAIDNFFVKQQNFTPFSFQFGYFSYPVSYVIENENLFSKKTLMHKTLFFEGDRAIGVMLEREVVPSFYWKTSLQSSSLQRGTDLIQKSDLYPIFTTSFIYEQFNKSFFASYFQQKFFLEGKIRSLGFGSDLFFDIKSLLLGFRGEFWGVKKSEPHQNSLTYYVFPYLKWKKWSFGFLFGRTESVLQKDQYFMEEYLFRGDFYFTKNLFFTVEWLKEQDAILKKKEWIFSLKTKF